MAHSLRSWFLALAVDDGLVYRLVVAGSTVLGLAVAMFFNRGSACAKPRVRW